MELGCVGCVLKRVIAASFLIVHTSIRLGVRLLEKNVTNGDFLTQERLNKKTNGRNYVMNKR